MVPRYRVYRHTLLASACVLGATLSLGGAQAAPAYSVIYNFEGFANGGHDGSSPVSEVTFDKAGNLYGVTVYGGQFNNGIVFGIPANGTYTVLHDFSGSDDSKTGGGQPEGGVTVSASGDLTGTTYYGGTTNNGTAWLLKPSGTYSVQHNFDIDEDYPLGTPLSVSGTTYGTTFYGDPNGTGTIWKKTKTGFSVIHGFTQADDEAAYPNGGLVQDSDGNLYGTGIQGGTSACSCGAVFRIGADGRGYKTLYSFTGGADGEFPMGAVVRDTDGTLYGTASETFFGYSCDTNGCGTLWQLTPRGKFTVLHTFTGGNKDGANPAGNLLKIGTAIYGTTQFGGGSSGCNSHGCGTVYKLSVKAGGNYKILHKFADGTSDGQWPLAGLARGPEGKLYGTTYEGGQYNNGTVFALSTK